MQGEKGTFQEMVAPLATHDENDDSVAMEPNEGPDLDEECSLPQDHKLLPSNPVVGFSSENGVVKDIPSVDRTAHQCKEIKQRNWKNLLLLGTAFLLNFSAYAGLEALQSSINCVQGLGMASLLTIYLGMIVSSLFFSALVIRLLGTKWTLASCMSCYTIYILLNFYPHWYTLIPGALLEGCAAAPMWTSESTYITSIARMHSEVTKDTADAVQGKFFGTFTGMFYFARISGNLISSTVYKKLLTYNHTAPELIESMYTCGANDCKETSGNITTYCNPPPRSITAIVLAIYTTLSALAILLIVFFLDKLPREKEVRKSVPVLGAAAATIRLWKDYRLWLVSPIILSAGLHMGVIRGDFTLSYVTCGIGIEYVGYVCVAHGLCQVIMSLSCGMIVKYTGRIAVMVFGVVIDVVVLIAMLLWEPNQNHMVVYFILSAGLGVQDAIAYTQGQAFFGVLFPKKSSAAFSNFHLCYSSGAVLSYAMSLFMCVSTKLYILLFLEPVAIILYVIVEVQYRKQRSNSTDILSQEKDNK
ncbi:protein unc-93 homolog A-like [Glandiceps talaboti]